MFSAAGLASFAGWNLENAVCHEGGIEAVEVRHRAMLPSAEVAMDGAVGYVTVWEFVVVPQHASEFLRYYGPEGVWASLFARADGYRGTIVLVDQRDPTRYMTVDRWSSPEAYEAFRDRFRADYEAVDRLCEAFASRETALGSFFEVSMTRQPPS